MSLYYHRKFQEDDGHEWVINVIDSLRLMAAAAAAAVITKKLVSFFYYLFIFFQELIFPRFYLLCYSSDPVGDNLMTSYRHSRFLLFFSKTLSMMFDTQNETVADFDSGRLG